MRVDVAFIPQEAAPAPPAIVVDVLRATSTVGMVGPAAEIELA
jgi:hypothetical protein